MPPPRPRGGPARVLATLLAAALGGLLPAAAPASPYEYLPVGDPLETELRLLDLFDSRGLGGHLALPHLGLRPLLRAELQGRGAAPETLDVVRAISVARLDRALQRDALPGFEPAPAWRSTPRLFTAGGGGQRGELSAALEGAAEADTARGRLVTNSGLHLRAGVQVDRWLFFSQLVIGYVKDAQTFADPIVPGHDFIAYTENTYLAYESADERFGMRFGRGRWHWGPGLEGSLLLSRTAAPLTGLSYQVHLPALHLSASALSATLQQAAGEQLAAHRVEWQPVPRLGATETARYRAAAWQPLYAVGALPYILVQRMLVQDEPDSGGALRNNVMVGIDAAWRVAQGARLYGELLLDDLHAKTADNPNKFGWQLGIEGAAPLGRGRLSGGLEYTRLSRYVYTSFFGRTYEAQGRPLGFPTGPDARRLSARAAWDPAPAWQVAAALAQGDHGEGGLQEPYLPGSGHVDVLRFEGVVERVRDAEVALRWWPASGVDLAARAGWRWYANQEHVAGRDRDHPWARLEARLTR